MRALICGISGQDGAYLAKLLLSKGYEVVGTSRDAGMSRLDNLERLGIRDKVRVVSLAHGDFRSVLQVLTDVAPDELYNLAGQSSVSLSFEQPAETLESIAIGTLNLLEAIRFVKRSIRFWNAASGECFGGSTKEQPANETTPFRPRSPYGTAKAASFWQVANYREVYGLFACSGLMFNHESGLRPSRFVTRKVVQTACWIAAGGKDRLRIGQTDVIRDWGYAPEYVEAAWLMLQQAAAADFVVASGHSCSLADFVRATFEELGLDWREHTDIDSTLFRPGEIATSYADPSLAREKLGWSAVTWGDQLAARLVSEEMGRNG